MKKFDLLLSETTNDTMSKIFGNAIADYIFGAAEKRLCMKREEIGQNFGFFFLYLERLLGREHVVIIQSVTLRHLFVRLSKEYEEVGSYFSLLDKLYETKFKLVGYSGSEEHPTCN